MISCIGVPSQISWTSILAGSSKISIEGPTVMVPFNGVAAEQLLPSVETVKLNVVALKNGPVGVPVITT